MGDEVTAGHCEAQLRRLAILRGVPAEVFEYFGALLDLPDERFTRAVDHALKTRTWFPTPSELRLDCDATAAAPSSLPEPRAVDLVGGGREVVVQNPFGGEHLKLHITREWKFDCDDCLDSGWRSRRCPEMACGKRYDHSAHEWVEPCQCRAWNPTLRRRREALGARFSKSPERAA
jgi:hypothetical protein